MQPHGFIKARLKHVVMPTLFDQEHHLLSSLVLKLQVWTGKCLADLVLVAKLSKVSKPLCPAIGMNVLKHAWVVLDVALEHVEGLMSLLAAATKHTDTVGTVVDEHTTVDGSVQCRLVGTEKITAQPGPRQHLNVQLGGLHMTQSACVRIMHHRLEVLMDTLAVARYTKCAQVGQHTDGTLVAFQQHLKHGQPQHEAHCIELHIALVTKLVMLQACMTKLSQVNDMKVKQSSHCAQCVRVHLTKRLKMLVDSRAAARQLSCIIFDLRPDW